MTPIRKLLALAALTGSIPACFLFGHVAPQKARRLVDHENARLLDVRSPAEFAGGHIDGAINIPIDRLEARWSELRPLQAPVVVYCQSGFRSWRAMRILADAGFTAVYDLGSMSSWSD